jgi:hypothetical protein
MSHSSNTSLSELKRTIKTVLESSNKSEGLLPGEIAVDSIALYYLQSEYNIHFVEPDEEQLDVLGDS